MTGRPDPCKLECAERLRNAILDSDFSELLGSRRITASFGVSAADLGDFERLYQEADTYLYQAETRHGRNRSGRS